jgi:hypothetical protein
MSIISICNLCSLAQKKWDICVRVMWYHIYFWRRRKAAKGGKKNAGWNTVKTVHAIASILFSVSIVFTEIEYGFNLHSIEQQELLLVPHERVTPSTSHLRQTVNATDEHSEVRKCDHSAKDLDLPQRDRALLLVRVVCALLLNGSARSSTLLVTNDVDQDQETANGHGDNLEGNTSDDHLVSSIDKGLVLSSTCCGQSTTDSLQHHGSEIASDEDPGIKAGLDQGVLWSAVQDEVLQGEVDGGGDKARSENKGTNLQFEPRVRSQ